MTSISAICLQSLDGSQLKWCWTAHSICGTFLVDWASNLFLRAFENLLTPPSSAMTVLFGAGHDNPVTPERAWSALEFEMSIHAGCNLHVHWQYLDCGQSIWPSAAHVWTTHDGAVQGGRPGGAVTPCVCDSRLSISPDEKRDA